MPPKKVNNLDITLKRFADKDARKLIKKNLSESSKLARGKFYTAYDPLSKQFIKGTLSDLSKKLKTSPQTISKRFNKNESVFNRDVNGFIITRYNDLDKLAQYEQGIKKFDKKIKNVEKVVLKKDDPKAYEKLLPANFSMKVKSRTENKKFSTNETQYQLNLGGDLTYEQIEGIFESALQKTIQKDKLVGDDKIRVILFDTNLQNPFSTPLLNVSEMNASVIMDVVGKTENYTEDYVISEDTEIIIITMKPDDEIKKKMSELFKKQLYKGLHSEADDDAEEPPKSELQLKVNTSLKKSMVTIRNKDDLCVPRAIATGYMMVKHGKNSTEYDNAKRGRKIQLDEAKKLVEQYEEIRGSKYEGNGFGVDDLEIFEVITGCQITAFDGDNGLNCVYPEFDDKYKPPDDESNTIYLYLSNGHCDLINNTRVAGFFGAHYFCHKCKKTYSHRDEHKCKFKCNICCSGSCPWIELSQTNKKNLVWIDCGDCGRRFPCKECYDNHKKPNLKGDSVCGKMWKCPDCKKLMSRETFPPETHVCGDFLCQNCKRVQPKEHQCYMKPKKLNEPHEKYIYFDFESDISAIKHTVMYAVSMYFKDETPIIHNSLDEWCNWAFSEENKGHTFIAHNGRGYDFRFIARWVFNNTKYKPFVIWGGEKIITMGIEELSIKFIDSLSFLTMPLKAFPKTFGIDELKKGFYPHWFNTAENWDYVGPMPPIDMFKPERMSPKESDEFHKWYKERIAENYVWNQQEEMKAYCISDVDILRKCCIQFRQLYLDVADIDPFTYLTIASVCMAIYRYWYIDETFPQRQKDFEKMKMTFAKGKPSTLKGKKLEIWNRYVEKFEKTNYDNYMGEKKIAIFKYEDVEWMRKAFFGGRTNAVKLIYNFNENEEGIYSDITSLYPTVNYYDIYPKGHPIILKENEITDIHYKKILRKEYLGFFDIEVQPPKDLYHPVLPEKGDKLIFDLNPKRGVWCSNEVYVALDKGYKITKVYEIRYFEEGTKTLFKGYVGKFLKIKQEASGYPKWVDEPQNEKNDIPEGYERNTIISMDKTARENLYIKLYEQGQGILLDKTKIVKNSGLRAIAKLCLNSLWGKFGQRTNMGHTTVVDDKEDYFKIIYNPKYENIQTTPLSDDKWEVSYSVKDEFVENDYSTNMAVACFTTSRARMRLYEEALDVLQQQVLYFDTDSVVYVYDKTNPEHIKLENGDLLGEWTDELEGAKMVGTFVSGGPKNYSYETLSYEDKLDKNGKVVKDENGKVVKIPKTEYKTKVKGFTLNVETKQKINHNTIIDVIKDTLNDEMNCNSHKIDIKWHGIKRAEDNTLESVSTTKRYGLCFTKRQICYFDERGNVDTIPFGYKDGIKREMIVLSDMEKENKQFKSV